MVDELNQQFAVDFFEINIFRQKIVCLGLLSADEGHNTKGHQILRDGGQSDSW